MLPPFLPPPFLVHMFPECTASRLLTVPSPRRAQLPQERHDAAFMRLLVEEELLICQHGRSGSFLSCVLMPLSTYPKCSTTRPQAYIKIIHLTPTYSVNMPELPDVFDCGSSLRFLPTHAVARLDTLVLTLQ